jgi:hypothetical protein
MTAPRFQVGDRVKARLTLPFVQIGTVGTVVLTFFFMPTAYRVLFDGQRQAWFMWGRDLELAIGSVV